MTPIRSTRDARRKPYGAMMIFLVVYLGALALIVVPKSAFTASGATTAGVLAN